MSVHEAQPNAECQESHPQDNRIDLIIAPTEKDLGGFRVRRSLPYAKRRTVGPWIFFDHMGPAEFPPSEGIDVRPHPHIHLATVTYLFEGEILHRDSLGSQQIISPGAVNLMVAGKGIAHSERTPDELRTEGHRLEGLQLWLAMPEEAEEISPAFYHHAASELPQRKLNGCAIRVMMGRAFGEESPVKCHSPTLFAEAHMPTGCELEVPKAVEIAVYVAHGQISIGTTVLKCHSLAVLNTSDVTLMADSDSRVIFIGGSALGKRHIWWNFVSSDAARIEQAKADWSHGRFPRIDGDDDEFIPLPAQ